MFENRRHHLTIRRQCQIICFMTYQVLEVFISVDSHTSTYYCCFIGFFAKGPESRQRTESNLQPSSGVVLATSGTLPMPRAICSAHLVHSFQIWFKISRTGRSLTQAMYLTYYVPTILEIGVRKRRVLPVRAMKAYRGVEVWLHLFLTLVTDVGELSIFTPLPPRNNYGAQFTGGWRASGVARLRVARGE